MDSADDADWDRWAHDLAAWIEHEHGRGKKLAGWVGLSPPAISMIKNGRRRPSPAIALRISFLAQIRPPSAIGLTATQIDWLLALYTLQTACEKFGSPRDTKEFTRELLRRVDATVEALKKARESVRWGDEAGVDRPR